MQFRKILFFFFLGLLAVSSNAQRVKRKGVTPIDVTKNKGKANGSSQSFTVEQFDGKWQEVSRTDRNHNPVMIKDTVMLNFTGEGKVITREGNQANIAGSAEIDEPGDVLLAAADVYTILSATKDQLVLDDQENYIHTFKKTDQFTYETYGRLSVNQDIFKEPVAIKLNDIMGKWSIYRKQAKPGAINPPTNIIELLYIKEKISDSSAKGEITFYQKETSQVLPCIIRVNNTGIEIIAGANLWNMFVYKADAKEFVFGDPETLLYYARPL